MSMVSHGALHGLRVLDLGGEIANYCGRMFAQLGAEVILVEPIAGSSYRDSAPQAHTTQKSLRFEYDNADKRSIRIDLSTPQGRETFQRLVASADLLLDDKTQHDLESHGLSYNELGKDYPRLIRTVITPFGLEGPYAKYEATDATCMALGGMLWLGGYEDGAPVQAAGRQAFRAGSLFGAVASMAAVISRDMNNIAEFVDVSVQECVSLGLENAIQFYDLEGHIRRRHGGRQKQAGFGVFPCSDGYVFLIAGGIGGNRFWSHFTEWMKSEQVTNAELLEDDYWGERAYVEGDEAKDAFWQIFTSFSMSRTKQELLEAAIKWNVPLSPVKTVSEVHKSEQLNARNFFAPTQVGNKVATAPGAPYLLSNTPWRHALPAPQPGEHTHDILTELDYTASEIAEIRNRNEVS